MKALKHRNRHVKSQVCFIVWAILLTLSKIRDGVAGQCCDTRDGNGLYLEAYADSSRLSLDMYQRSSIHTSPDEVCNRGCLAGTSLLLVRAASDQSART